MVTGNLLLRIYCIDCHAGRVLTPCPTRPTLDHAASRPKAGRHLKAGLLAVALALVVAAPDPGEAQQSATEAQRKLEETRRRLDERKQAETALSTDVSAIQADHERLRQSLLETGRLIRQSEGKLTSIESRQGELEAQEKLLRGSLVQRHESILKLLGALQRMGRNPPPAIITQRDDALRMVRSAQMLATVFPGLRTQALELASQLDELARVMGEIKSEGDKLKSETVRLNESQTRLAMLNEQRRMSLSERQAELDKVRREAMDIAKGVTELADLIARLDKIVPQSAPEPAPKQPPAPAQDVAALPPPKAPITPPVARQAPVAATPPGGPAAGAPPPAKGPDAATIEIAPKGTQVAALNPGRMKPAIPFAQSKGQLQLPAQGRRVLAFGDKTQNDGRSKGIVLETRHSAQVASPADGWVVYAGEFRTFGQLLIINAGDGYHILLAGLSNIDVQLGEFVLAGLPVGVMPAALKGTKAKSADNAPVLYVEFRKDSTPINPDPWWLQESSKKVQG